MDNQSYRLTYGKVCCCAVVQRGRVDPQSAPVVRWAWGKPWETLRKWVLARGGTVEELRG